MDSPDRLDALNVFVNEFIWHDAFIKDIKIFLPVYVDEDGVAGEGTRSSITLIVSDGNGEAWEFLFMNVSEHNLNAQSYLDDSCAEMNSLQNEITWHWGGEYVKAEKVCYRKRSSEVLTFLRKYYRDNGMLAGETKEAPAQPESEIPPRGAFPGKRATSSVRP